MPEPRTRIIPVPEEVEERGIVREEFQFERMRASSTASHRGARRPESAANEWESHDHERFGTERERTTTQAQIDSQAFTAVADNAEGDIPRNRRTDPESDCRITSSPRAGAALGRPHRETRPRRHTEGKDGDETYCRFRPTKLVVQRSATMMVVESEEAAVINGSVIVHCHGTATQTSSFTLPVPRHGYVESPLAFALEPPIAAEDATPYWIKPFWLSLTARYQPPRPRFKAAKKCYKPSSSRS
ncbi:hypothetical protein C8R45DRAFT_933788 [Mycena sanguinolenta]|nr:hypothetical protein C8R45DRAFT_933788 [Mycena sanguinolenta]